jgi:Cu-Zn family superoxide dismutase
MNMVTNAELGRHAGDLINNIKSDDEGNFVYEYNDELLNLFGPIQTTIIGRSVVIHDGVDDLGLGGLNNDGTVDWKKFETSLENGNAGSRMACAIIGIASNN